jgi:hypothetical protein
MNKPGVLLFFVFMTLCAQTVTPGTVTTTGAVTGTAGTVTCSFSNQSPPAAAGVHINCVVSSGIGQMSQDSVVPIGSPNGIAGSFNANGNSVTWILLQPTAAGPVSWQVAANGTMKSGTF